MRVYIKKSNGVIQHYKVKKMNLKNYDFSLQYVRIDKKRISHHKVRVYTKKQKEGKNVEVVIALYVFETKDRGGRTLELDIVGKMIISLDNFNKIIDISEYFRSVVVRQLERKKYGGLAVAIKNIDVNEIIIFEKEYDLLKELKSGIQFNYTNEGIKDFEFIRVFINKKDYLEKVKKGVATQKKLDDKNEKDKE